MTSHSPRQALPWPHCLCACVGRLHDLPAGAEGLQRGDDPALSLDSGDRLRITVFDQAGLTNTYTVDQAGYVAFPLIGQVPPAAEPCSNSRDRSPQKLQQGYLRDPDVTIEVDRYRSVFIMGEVGQPGQYAYVPGMTVQNAIAVAGGFTSRANQRMVDVTRKINGQMLTGRVNDIRSDHRRRHDLRSRTAVLSRWQNSGRSASFIASDRRSAEFSAMSAIWSRSTARRAMKSASSATARPAASYEDRSVRRYPSLSLARPDAHADPAFDRPVRSLRRSGTHTRKSKVCGRMCCTGTAPRAACSRGLPAQPCG